jgi:HEAT repeat protein
MPLIKRARPTAAAQPSVESTLATLLADLQNEAAAVRLGAARQLGQYPEAAGALCTALAAEQPECVREAIFTALIRLGTRPAAEGLVPLLASEDAGLRNGAIEALKTMPETAAPSIFASLKDDSRDVRIFAVSILGALARRDSPDWLIRVLEEDPDENVCAEAVEGLAECGNAAAVAPLRGLLERFPNEPFLEFCVQTALARIGAD